MTLPPAADQGILEQDAIPAGSVRLRCLPARYPAAVCVTCVERGRPLPLYNWLMSGGFQAICAAAGDPDTGEAHLDGIVVHPL